MTKVLYRLAQFSVRNRFVVLGVWATAAVALLAVSHSMGDNTNDNLSLPGTNSQRATDALAKSFLTEANGTSPIVLHVPSGKLTDSKYASAVNGAAADVAKAPNVASVVNPLTSQGASALSKDQSTGYLSVGLKVSPGSLSVDGAQAIIDAAAKPAKAAGIEVQIGGQLGQKVSRPATESSELIGIIAAMVILTFTFGTISAMAVPILTAIFALITTLSIIRMLSRVATVPTVAPTLATMIGLGVGIDYALFIVTRHVRGLHDGLDMNESIARAAATSGGAVFFAGSTVTIALVSLAIAGIPLVTTMGLMAAVAVVVAVFAALTLLPAALAVLGPRINSLRVRELHPEDHAKNGLWAKWAADIAKQPLIAGLVALLEQLAERSARDRPPPADVAEGRLLDNLLSIGASYGVLTAIFQYGWLSGLIGLPGPVPIISYVPLFMFAVPFGLSMDYEVFLVSQIEEHVHAGQDNKSSVVSGLVTSARVITAAAAIMVFVFGSFVLNGDPTVKQFGNGLAVAVILDATIVRCLLVPALMVLMGKINWYMPRWLDRVVPRVSIEGAEFFAARDQSPPVVVEREPAPVA